MLLSCPDQPLGITDALWRRAAPGGTLNRPTPHRGDV